MTRRSTFRQADLVRALKAAKDAGLEVASFEITPEGRIIVKTGSDSQQPAGEPEGWGE